MNYIYIYDELYFNSLNIDFAVSEGIFDETKTFKHKILRIESLSLIISIFKTFQTNS